MSRIPTPPSVEASPAASKPPLAHAAEYDDFCAVAVSMGEHVLPDATSVTVHGGRTFRFSSPEAKAMFDADPVTFRDKADTHWPRLQK